MNTSQQPKEAQCDICSILQFNANASHVCIHCQKLLCNGCTGTHNNDKLFTNHTVLSIKNSDGVTLHCVRHPKENVHLYCVTCAKAICVVCALSIHNDHDKEDFQQYVLRQRDTLRKLLKEAEAKEQEGISIIEQINNNIAESDRDLEHFKEEISHHYDMIKKAVEDQQQALINKISQMTAEKQQGLTETKEGVNDRMRNLLDHTALAKDLTSNDIKIVKLTNKFVSNFERSLEIMDEETKEAMCPKPFRFIPSYDINLGVLVNTEADDIEEDYDHYDHMRLRKLSISSDESSSLGFHDGSGYLSGFNSQYASPRDKVGNSSHSHQHGQLVGYGPARKLSESFNFSLEDLSSLVTTEDELTPRVSPEKDDEYATEDSSVASEEPDKNTLKTLPPVAQIKPNRIFRRRATGEPQLLYIIDYKDVPSVDPIGYDKFKAVPIGLAFKNEHKLLVTQWGVLPRSKHNIVPRYYPARVGMVLFSLCNSDPCPERYFTDCSPWSVAVHQGLFYVTDNRTTMRTVHKYIGNGTQQSSWPSHSFTEPRGLAISGNKVVVTDISHKQIRVCVEYKSNKAATTLKIGKPGRYRRARSNPPSTRNPSNNEESQEEGLFEEPMFVTTNSLGWIIVSDAGDNSIKIFSPEGDSLYKIKNFRSNDRLKGPMGVVTDVKDNIYVADYGNNRIVKFNQKGEYLCEVLNSSVGGIHNPRDIALYSSVLAVSCHDANGVPVVLVFEMEIQLQKPTEVKCPCNWLRLCGNS